MRRPCRSTLVAKKVQGALNRRLLPGELQTPLKITNAGEGNVQAVVTVSGAPLVPEPAAEKGFKIERKYYTLAGKPADPSKARQNDRFAVVLKITEPQPQLARIIVDLISPRGSRSTIRASCLRGMPARSAGIEDAQEPVSSEFRDHRFSAAFDRKQSDPSVSPRWLMSCARSLRVVTSIRGRQMRKTCTGLTASVVLPRARLSLPPRSEMGASRCSAA